MRTMIAALALIALPLDALQVTFGWTANPEPDIAEYRLYILDAEGEPQLAGTAQPDAVELEIEADQGAVAYLTAVNTTGLESAPSNYVTVPTAPSAPTGLRVKVVVEIQQP